MKFATPCDENMNKNILICTKESDKYGVITLLKQFWVQHRNMQSKYSLIITYHLLIILYVLLL